MAPVLRERVFGRRLHARRRVLSYIGGYNLLDVRGSYTITGYKRIEAEFVAPRLFNRRGTLSVLGGWREATQVGFYGIGTDTSKDDRTNYASSSRTGRRAADVLADARALDAARRRRVTRSGRSSPARGRSRRSRPSTRRRRCRASARKTTYLHSQGTVGFDWRTSPGYSRRGGFYGVTLHDYTDSDEQFGFQQVDYEAIQHFRSCAKPG